VRSTASAFVVASLRPKKCEAKSRPGNPTATIAANRRFTTSDARIKLTRLYPKL